MERKTSFADMCRFVITGPEIHAGRLQIQFGIGYVAAQKLIDLMVLSGIVAPFDGSKYHQVLIKAPAELEKILLTINQ